MAEQEVIKAMQDWADAFSAVDSNNICACYAPEANLWPTFSPEKHNSPALIKRYFDWAFTFQCRNVAFESYQIQLFESLAISNGLYRFSWHDGHQEVVTDARFSFVFKRLSNRWKIVEHHSSVIPKRK